MYELLIVACLTATPEECVEKRVKLYRPVGAMNCLRVAQIQARDWETAHPTYSVRKWRCVPERTAEKATD